jgi:hypothetical protein
VRTRIGDSVGMTSIPGAKNAQGPPTLDEIETHVVWLYATAVCVLRKAPSNDDDARRLTRRVLMQSEAFQSLVDRIVVVRLDADLAVVLRRALDVWNTSIECWRDDARCHALTASAAQLADVGEVLVDALASAPWVHDDGAVTPVLGHTGRKPH